MRLDEFDAFKAELKQLCASFGKAYTDALGQAYWRVLHDAPLSEVEANVERILLSAGQKTPFPKPSELRNNAPSGIRTPSMDADFTRMVERNSKMWNEWFAEDAEMARIELGIARCGRILAADFPGSPQYAMALQEDRQLRDRRHKAWEQRAAQKKAGA